MDESFRVYCRIVWRHWKVAVLAGLLPGVAFVFWDLILDIFHGSRWIRLAIYLVVLVLFLFYATFLTWRSERRTRRADIIRDLIGESHDIGIRLDKFVETRRNERKQPESVALLASYWLPDIDPSEVEGRDVRHRIHIERLKRANITGSALDAISDKTLCADIKNALAAHETFMRSLIQASDPTFSI
jgi:hypothetical protein